MNRACHRENSESFLLAFLDSAACVASTPTAELLQKGAIRSNILHNICNSFDWQVHGCSTFSGIMWFTVRNELICWRAVSKLLSRTFAKFDLFLKEERISNIVG